MDRMKEVQMEQKTLDELREQLLAGRYRLIDILPRQVSAENGERWFAVERFFREQSRIAGLYRRFARLLLKLSCYAAPAVYDPEADAWRSDLSPEELAARTEACAAEGGRYLHVLFPAEGALLALDGGDLYMTMYGLAEGLPDTRTSWRH